MENIKNRKGQLWGTLIPWIIALAVLVLVVIGIMILIPEGQSIGAYIKNLLFGK